MKKKELFWLLGTLALVAIVVIILFGANGFEPDSTLDINIHDTYIVFANFHLTIIILILTFFGVYLLRTLKRNFKNLIANLILMISTIFLVIILTGLSSIIDSIISEYSGWTIYPPLNARMDVPSIPEIEKEIGPVERVFGIFSNIVLITQIVLLILLAYCGFKTGRNFITES